MATYECSVTARFKARHSVRTPQGGFEPIHEHDWGVTAVFRAPALDDDGFVVDFLQARAALQEVLAGLEGTDLNEVVPAGARGASAERLAEHVARRLRDRLGRTLHCVRVTEALGCSAAFYPGGGAA